MSSVSPACFLNWTLQPNYYLILTEYILYKHSPSHSANTLVVLVADSDESIELQLLYLIKAICA